MIIANSNKIILYFKQHTQLTCVFITCAIVQRLVSDSHKWKYYMIATMHPAGISASAEVILSAHCLLTSWVDQILYMHKCEYAGVSFLRVIGGGLPFLSASAWVIPPSINCNNICLTLSETADKQLWFYTNEQSILIPIISDLLMWTYYIALLIILCNYHSTLSS